MPTMPSPGRLLRLTLQVYRNQASSAEERETFAREYLAKAAALHAKNGIEMYQQVSQLPRTLFPRQPMALGVTTNIDVAWHKVFTPIGYRNALEEMNRRNNRGWTVDDHDLTVEFYFRTFAELSKVNSDPEFQALQATEGPYVNLVHTVATLGWVEKHVDGGKVVNLDEDGKSTYPSWTEMNDLSTAFPAGPAEGAKYGIAEESKEGL
ncbi:hypothetical protein PG985_013060 [Apiospora marii]|uniref:EthD domain-containing protein n=1 Tax=Apiospora marii TaxID=335849 RepID=A0ABR1RBU8_9PEZI